MALDILPYPAAVSARLAPVEHGVSVKNLSKIATKLQIHDRHLSSKHIILMRCNPGNGEIEWSFRMSRPRFQCTVQYPPGMPHAAVLAATSAVAILADGAIFTAVNAQQRDPVDQRRLEAPVGHRQPRPQDLPSRAPQDENNARDVNRNFEVSPEINICRGC